MKILKTWKLAWAMLIACPLASCDSSSLDGLWDAIKMDKSMAVIDCSGGSDTIRLKNYSSWWLSEVDVRVNDTTVHRLPVYTTDESAFYTMEGDWYHIQIPQDNKKLLVVKCSENTHHDYRELNIGVTVGDAFNTVRIIQSASE